MAKNSSSINTDFIISFFLPEGMIDWFEVVNIKEEPNKGTAQADILYNSVYSTSILTSAIPVVEKKWV